jgi:glycosyltransferase involved in cell wall biosynthesis
VKKKKHIFVLDVHASEAGALTILDDFYEQVHSSDPSLYTWTFLVSTPRYKSHANLKILRYPWIKKSLIHRIIFDKFFVKKIIDQHKPDLILNLQNKCVNIKDTPQFVYLHLPFILTNHKFKLFKDELRLWIYQNIYKKIIFSSYKNANKIIVQTQWMKDSLVLKAKIPDTKIDIIHPSLSSKFEDCECIGKISGKAYFYPATSFSYKNHIVILMALKEIKEVFGINLKVKFTISESENKYTKNLKNYSIKNNLDVVFLGKINRDEVINYYLNNILIFPSFVESFGLPLLEGRTLGIPVIAHATSFSEEILKDYDQAFFFDGQNYRSLVKILLEFEKKGTIKKSIQKDVTYLKKTILNNIETYFYD